jgi:hypothetical protein
VATGNGETGPDRLAIAEQVIVSAGNILVAAGFGREEIESFFRQAADQLAADSEGAVLQGASGDAQDPAMHKLRSDFHASAPVRELSKLQARAAGLDPAGDEAAALKDHFDLAMQAVPHIADAQEWLRRTADQAGLRIFADRREFRSDTANRGLPDSSEAIFFEDFESAYAQSFGLICAVTGSLAERGDEQAFAFLLESLLENGVIITYEAKQAMERSAEVLAAKSASSSGN